MAGALDQTERPGFAYTDAYAFDPRSGRVRKPYGSLMPIPPPTDWKLFLLALLDANFVYNSTTVPRVVLDEVGLFDEAQTRSEDYDLWLRIVVAGYCPVWVPGRHALYRVHAAQVSRDQAEMTGGMLAVYTKVSLESMPSDAHRELLVRRRHDCERDLRVVSGADRLGWILWRLHELAGRIRRSFGFGGSWLKQAPADVAGAFADLTSV